MITDQHVAETAALIEQWKDEKDRLVIGIDGYSGAGKTSLSLKLAQALDDALVVYRDDFSVDRSEFTERWTNSSDRAKTIAYEMVAVDEICDLVGRYRAVELTAKYRRRDEVTGERQEWQEFDLTKSILLVEGIFLFHPDLVDLFDRRIWLEVNQEQADKRRRKREREKWGADYVPDTDPDSYFRFIKIAFNNYLAKHGPVRRADVVCRVDEG